MADVDAPIRYTAKEMRQALLIARSEAHADQYDTETLRWALLRVPLEPQQTILRRVLDKRQQGQTTRITGQSST